jgi:sugar phosphate isomerase/epimerase
VAFPDGYERLKPWIVHVQVKDVRRRPDGRTGSVGLCTGEVDYAGQLRALPRDGYRGYLSLKTHWRLHRHLPEAVVRLPQGSPFSLGGEEATRRCLMRLRPLLQQL